MPDLTTFLKQHQQGPSWSRVREEWLETLSELISTIKEWLADPANEGLVEFEDYNKEINGKDLGRYSAPSLRISTQLGSITIIPHGRLILGARGRVDVIGPAGRYLLLLVPEKGGWVVATDNDRQTTKPLTEDTFSSIIQELLA